MKAKIWQAGVITIVVTFVVTIAFIWVVSKALDGGQDSVRLPLLIVAAVVGLLGAIAFVVVAFSLYGLHDGNEPLGLPEGSIPALLALLILVIFASMTIFFVSSMQSRPLPASSNAAARTTPAASNKTDYGVADDLAKQVLTILGTLLTAIASFYFGSQSAASAVKAATPRAVLGPSIGGGHPGEAGGGGGSSATGGSPEAGGGPPPNGPLAGPPGSSDRGAFDVALRRPLQVLRPLVLRRPRVEPHEKSGMDEAK